MNFLYLMKVFQRKFAGTKNGLWLTLAQAGQPERRKVMRNIEIMQGISNAEKAIESYKALPENIRESAWIQAQMRKAEADRKEFLEILISVRRQQVSEGI